MFCFAFGFLLGLVSAVGVTGSLAWWLVRGANRSFAAKLLKEFAVGLASMPEAGEIATPPNMAEPAQESTAEDAAPETVASFAVASATPAEVNTARNRLLLELTKAINGNRRLLPDDARKQGNGNDGQTEDHGHER